MNFKFRNYYLDEGKFVTSYPIAGGADFPRGRLFISTATISVWRKKREDFFLRRFRLTTGC